MTPEQILSHPPKILSQEQREDYFDLGYVKVEGLIPKNTLVELRRMIDKVLDQAGKKPNLERYLIWAPGIARKNPC